MITLISLIVLGALFLVSYLDLKYRTMPSVILSSLIFVLLIIYPSHLIFGLTAFAFAFMMKDLTSNDFGVADIKVMIVIGLMIGSLNEFILMIFLFVILQFAYTVIWRWKFGKGSEMAFVPCLTLVYIAMMILGGFA